MSNFSKVLLTGLLCLVAACSSTGPEQAGAQDLSVQLHQDQSFMKPRESTQPRPSGSIPWRVTRALTPEDPVRILVIGDSLADGFGMFMEQRVHNRGLAARVSNRGKTSSGLARRDFYDWPANFRQQAAAVRPDIVVAHFGANDDKPVVLPGGSVAFGTPEWETAYREQVREVLSIAAQNGAAVYLLGPAPDRDARRNSTLTTVNRLFREEAQMAGAHFLSLPAFAAGPSGEFVSTVNVNGTSTTIRAPDGSHFNVTGYYLVVDNILAAIERDNPGIMAPPSTELAGDLQ